MTTETQTKPASQFKPFAELKAEATDKWPYLFNDLAPQLAEAMASSPHHVPCPVHGGGNGFRLFPDFAKTGGGVCNTCGANPGGFALLAWVRGYALKDAIRDVAAWLGSNNNDPTVLLTRTPLATPKVIDAAKAYANIRKVWTATTPLAETAAEKYLMDRGIWKENLPSTLRAHPGLSYIHGKEMTRYGDFPCLLAPIKDKDGRLVSIHRIFLTPEGKKAPVPAPKKMMSPHVEIRGAAIKLFPAGEVLGLAEGVETALAVHAVSRMPVWSCVSATLMELVDVPDTVKHVVIWADLDRSNRGIEAAEKLANRLEASGKTVEICLPFCAIPDDEKGVDWLDVMLRQGLSGFPAKWRRWRPPVVATGTTAVTAAVPTFAT